MICLLVLLYTLSLIFVYEVKLSSNLNIGKNNSINHMIFNSPVLLPNEIINDKMKSSKNKLKFSIEIKFAKQNIKMYDSTPFVLQNTSPPLPSNVKFIWESSNIEVLSLSDVRKTLTPGFTRLTLRVLESDLYNESMGYYDLFVYGIPDFRITDIYAKSSGITTYYNNTQSNIWKPIYTDDSLYINWHANMNDDYRPIHNINFMLYSVNKENKPIIYKSIQYEKNIRNENEIVIEPQISFFDATSDIHVSIEANGYSDLKTSYLYKILVETENPERIGKIFTSAMINYRLTHSKEQVESCVDKSTTIIEYKHYIIMNPRTELTLHENKILLMPLCISHFVDILGSYSRTINYNNKICLLQNGIVHYSGNDDRLALMHNCMDYDTGSCILRTVLEFGSKTYTSRRTFEWTGSGKVNNWSNDQ